MNLLVLLKRMIGVVVYMGRMLLKEASEIALRELNGPSNLGEILYYIKENELFSFNTKDERGILRKNLQRNEQIVEQNGFYSLKNLLSDNIIENGNYKEEKISKIFISHAHADQDYVRRIVDLLESLGVGEKQIFCTSCPPYGIGLSENFLDTIKKELNNNVLVLFILSNNFYKSPVSMCEMGAVWVNSKEHVPIIIPPFKFEDIKGVIPFTQGFKIDDDEALDYFQEYISRKMSIETSVGKWNRKKKEFMDSINRLMVSEGVIKEV